MDRPCNRTTDDSDGEDDNVCPVKEPRTCSPKWWKNKKANFKIHKELVPLKLAIMLFYGADSLFLPYLTLQMVQVGMDLEEVAIIYAVLPFVTFIIPPVAGLLADKFNRYKLFLIGLVALSGIFHTLLLFVDARIPAAKMEVSLTATLSCSRTGSWLRLDTNDTGYCGSGAPDNEWMGSLDPSKCLPINCASSALRMHYCNVTCSPITLNSSFAVVTNFRLFGWDDEAETIPSGGNCTTGQASEGPSALLCSCLLECPVNLTKTLNNTLVDPEELANAINKHRIGFWIYFLLRIVASSTLAAAFSMLDATATCMVKKFNGDLGKQRLFGVIGQAAFGMIGGLLLDWTVEVKGFPDYSVLFYLADGLFFLGILLIGRLDVDVELVETGSMASGLKKLVRLIDVDVFMLMMLLLGTCWGYLESFLFVFLMELNASSFLLGTTVFMGCTIGVPFLYISDAVVRKIGSVNVIIIAFFLYGIRFFGYSLIWEPWLCLIFEALEAMTVHMMAVASTMYCAAAAPPGLLATLNGAVGSVHYSFGRGVGSFAGGILMATYGTRATFQMFGTAALICGLLYLLAHRFFLVKMEKFRLRRRSERIASIIASGAEPEEDEPDQKFIIPPDMMMGRRMSCF